MADSSQHYAVVLLGESEEGHRVAGNSDLDTFTVADVPRALRDAVGEEQKGPRATRRRTTCSGSGRWRTGRRT